MSRAGFDSNKEKMMTKILEQEAFIKKLCDEPDESFEKIKLEICDLTTCLKKTEVENLRLETKMNIMHQRTDVDYQNSVESLQVKIKTQAVEKSMRWRFQRRWNKAKSISVSHQFIK